MNLWRVSAVAIAVLVMCTLFWLHTGDTAISTPDVWLSTAPAGELGETSSTTPFSIHTQRSEDATGGRDERTEPLGAPSPTIDQITTIPRIGHDANLAGPRAELGPNDFEEWVRRKNGLEAPRAIVEGRTPRSLELVRAGSGVAFRESLEWTATDKEVALRHEAAIRLGPSAYFDLLADTPTPLVPWKKTATPIVCHGREYYSGHFSIPAENIVPRLPPKTRDWATVVPGRKETYVFKTEPSYRKDLEESRFGITRRRYGFATNRNLEMLAAGCVPYFCGIHRVPKIGTLDSLPKQFFEMMLRFPGLGAKCYPPRKAIGFPLHRDNTVAGFNDTKYNRIAEKLLDYTRAYQISTHFAKYVLSATSLKTLPRNVLVVWASHYTILLTSLLHGLRGLGIEVEDVPRRNEVYKGEGCAAAQLRTYAKGWFFFCRTEESKNVSRRNIEARIRAREFDAVIVSVTDTLTYHMKDPASEIPFYETIVASYPRDLILAMNDADLIKPMTADVAHRLMHNQTLYFKRETHGCHEFIW